MAAGSNLRPRWLWGGTSSERECVKEGFHRGKGHKGKRTTREATNKEGECEHVNINSQPDSSRQTAWMIRKCPTEVSRGTHEGWGLNPSLHGAPMNCVAWVGFQVKIHFKVKVHVWEKKSWKTTDWEPFGSSS